MKRIIIAALMLTALPLLFACGKAPAATTEPATTVVPDEPDSPAVTSVQLTVNSNDLAGYTIVYAAHPYDVRLAARFTTEYDFYKLIAVDIAERIWAQTGVVLPIAKDTSTDEGALEILVGPTNRAESDPLDAMDVYDTYVKVVGSKLVVGGGYDSSAYTGDQRNSYCFASTNHAWDAVETYLADQMAAGTTAVDLSADADFSTTVDLITVACIGDSITEGDGSDVWSIHSYPAVLERYLWEDHLVINLGKCGKTLLEDHERHYRGGCVQYTAMTKYASKFDYVLFMLGTNDFIQHTTWPAGYDEKFLTSADHLVEDITKKNKDVEFVVMNSAVYYGTSGASADHVRDLQSQLPARLEAAGFAASFFDMYSYTVENVGKANFKDTTHPNNNGYAIIAKGVYEMLLQVEAGTYNAE
ncbi:MAG: SGNH/GDSL hydrolase family protein [Clostridia bacterium]|nr:SGNH/GDSL hydrolase family protein [Clostridia bacterium]